ncbi:uncharacterized protein LOC127255179 [Andrographis paniculata]|uniref:uncharacterized protein LOC127255179 n=1 Tax=Andrographis paniculata TaxID=175694 RepID=UPI0021E915D5|nr:uncharacterized protein LOC127255179 [Andrographis paniculata]
MAPHRDIGWDHATPISNDRKQAKCNYCGKIVHGGITRMKQHIAHVTGQVEACTRAPKEIRELLKKHLIQGKSMRAAHKKKLEALQNSIRLEDDSDEEEDEVFEINEDEIDALERKHLKRAMAESRNMEFMEQQRRHSVSGDLPSLNFKAGGSSSNTKGSKRNFFESSMKKTEAYFLNPGLQYSGTCEFDSSEVRKGVKEVIKRLEPDLDIQVKAMNEINIFVNKIGEFGSALAIRVVSTSLPADWWNMYGDEAPNLRKIALKVLSQTCTSSGCERNWSTWALIHTKLRNRLAIEKLHKLVYVHYNMRLRMNGLEKMNLHLFVIVI